MFRSRVVAEIFAYYVVTSSQDIGIGLRVNYVMKTVGVRCLWFD